MSDPVERMGRTVCIANFGPHGPSGFGPCKSVCDGCKQEAEKCLACAREIAEEAAPERYSEHAPIEMSNEEAAAWGRGHNACRAAILAALTREKKP